MFSKIQAKATNTEISPKCHKHKFAQFLAWPMLRHNHNRTIKTLETGLVE